jgi:predicted ATP-grasp superfamily ATP-dependent carboligase
MRSTWPRSGVTVRLDAAILDADARQSLVSVRSLGRAGLQVGAFDAGVFSPAFASRWCSLSGRLPDESNVPAYLDAVESLVETFHPRTLLVARDSTIEALRAHRNHVERSCSLALAPEPALEIAVSKERTLELAARLGIPIPTSVPIQNAGEVGDATARTGFPAVVKPVRSWIRTEAGGRRLGPSVVVDVEDARTAAAKAMDLGAGVVVQEWIPGSREAVSLFYVDGKVHARFAQRAWRMLPPVGGASIVRESIRLPPDLTDAAEAFVRAAGLSGYSEVEFRRDRDGSGRLMEANPRLSASVEVAVRAGVDFPRLLYAWSTGSAVPMVASYRVGLRMRWLGGDIRWLGETLRQQGRPDAPPPLRALLAFARDSVVPHAYDYLAWDDLRPAAIASAKFLAAKPVRRYTARQSRKVGGMRSV